jgi:hypothetical protein
VGWEDNGLLQKIEHNVMVVQTYGILIFHNYITTDAIIDTQIDRIKLNAAQHRTRQNTAIVTAELQAPVILWAERIW